MFNFRERARREHVIRRLAVALAAAISWSCTSRDRDGIVPDEFPAELRDAASQVAAVHARDPDNAAVLYQWASLLNRAGRQDEALDVLERMASFGTGADPRLRDGFQTLEKHARFVALRDRIQREHPPARFAAEAFAIAEGDLVPEGIAWSENRQRFYVGSVKRKIVELTRTGQARALVPEGSHNIGSILGLRVDDERDELWAASSTFGPHAAGGTSGIYRFRLGDGALIAVYPVDTTNGAFVNDLAVAPDGTVYATVTATGALLRIAPSSQSVVTFLPPGSLPDPNGVAVSADGRFALVAGWYGISRVDLRSGAVSVVKQPRNVVSGCFDGLYFAGTNAIVGVQNCIHASGRLLRLGLTSDLDSITTAAVIESYNPVFENLTTAAVVQDSVFFVANTQFRRLQAATPPAFDTIRVLKAPLVPR